MTQLKQESPSKKKFTSIELFAGAGGLALGLEMAGFEHLGLVEFDKHAAVTLKHNRPTWNVLCADVAQVASQDLSQLFGIARGELDLLSGGAPCQSFSYAGKRLGLEDTRGTMFYHYATFLTKLQPKMFLFENVRGMLSHDRGKTFATICDIFEQQGYSIFYEVLNALDYSVAQKRERLIIVGVRKDLVVNYAVNHPTNIGNEVSNGFKGYSTIPPFTFPEKHSKQLVLRDILQDVPPSECAKYSTEKAKLFSLIPPGGYWRDLDPSLAKAYMKGCWESGGGKTGILRRLNLDQPSLTILTTPQMKQTERCHPTEVRPLSVRESARIQSFPDSWEFKGSVAAKYKQIGNAVPCNLAKAVGESIAQYLHLLEQRA